MIRICPNPALWYEVYLNLVHYAETHRCNPPQPPRSLVLSGWIFSNDNERKTRWEETVRWASANNCLDLIEDIPISDFYEVEELTTCQIGPLGGPMFRPWDYEPKEVPTQEALESCLNTLIAKWESIAGNDLSEITKPYMFTGKKARRLLVYYQNSTVPPWGAWSHLPDSESKRRSFTKFRASINEAIAPHEVDHIEFISRESTKKE